MLSNLTLWPRSTVCVLFLHEQICGADDDQRPWVRQEKERFKALMLDNNISVHEHKYLDGQAPTLLMHFESIEQMDRCRFASA